MSEELYKATVRITPDLTGLDEEVHAKVDAATAGRHDVKIGVDTGDAAVQLAALDEEVKKVDRDARSAGGGINFMVAGIAAALPLVPTLAGGLGAVAGVFAAGGAAALSFGAVVETSLKQATTANTELAAAQKAVDDATTKSSRTKALQEQSALITQLGPATIALGQGLKDITTDWTKFADSFIPQELQLVSGFEQLEKDTLPKLRPLLDGTFTVVRADIDKLDAAVNSPNGQSFFSWLATEGPRDLQGIAEGVGHFAAGFGDLLQSFTPVERQLVSGFDNIGASFQEWAGGTGSRATFQKFLSDVEKDGPLVVHTLADVGSAVGHITGAFGGMLPYELRFLDDIATLIKNHPALSAALAAVFTGFEALKVVGTITGPVGTLFGLLKDANTWLAGTATAEMRVAGSTAAVGTAAASAEAPAGLFLGTVGEFSPVSIAAAEGLESFAGAEAFAGTAAAGAEGPIAALGTTIAATSAEAKGLLGLLGAGGLAGAATAVSLAGVSAFDKTVTPSTNVSGNNALDNLLHQVETEPGSGYAPTGGTKPSLFGNPKTSPVSTGDAVSYIEKYGTSADVSNLYILSNGQYGNLTKPGGGHLLNPTAAQGNSTTGGGMLGNLVDQITGGVGSVAKAAANDPEAQYLQQFNSNLNNPANMLPLTGGGGGAGSKAAATAAQNNAAALAYLLGISIPNSLAQGIQTGTNPLQETFTNLNLKLTGTTQTLAQTMENLFSTADQYGQKVAANFAPNLLSGLPQMGNVSTVSVGANGQLVTQQQSPILGGLQSMLSTDKSFVADIAKLRKLGANESIIDQFVQAGPSSFSTLDALVNGSPGDIASINSTYGQINSLGTQFGQQQATNQYLSQLVAQNAHLLQVILSQLPPAIARQVGPAVAAALNGTAKTAARLAATTPALGPFSR